MVVLGSGAFLSPCPNLGPAPLPPAADQRNTRRNQSVELLPLLETSEIDVLYGTTHLVSLPPTRAMNAPSTAQRKAKTKVNPSPWPQMQHPLATQSAL